MELYTVRRQEEVLDTEGDQIGVVLDNSVVCGSCATRMDHVGKHVYRCPRCGMVFDELTA